MGLRGHGEAKGGLRGHFGEGWGGHMGLRGYGGAMGGLLGHFGGPKGDMWG